MSPRAWMLRLRDALGAAAVVGTLALLSPGVSLTAHADGEAAQVDGPSCQESAGAEQLSLQLEQWMEMMRASAAAQQRSAADGDTIVLNNRGYYYGPFVEPEPSRAESESERP